MRYLFAFILSSISIIAVAQRNGNIIKTADNTFSVGTYATPFRSEKMTRAGLENDLHRDWALCIVMVLNHEGLNVSEEQVMSLVNGSPTAPLGAPQDLAFAINKTTPPEWGKRSKIYCDVAVLDPDVIFDELAAGRPLILGTRSVGLEGRAFVVGAMSYHIVFDADGQQTGIKPVSVTLRDPWPTGLSNRTIEWSDFVMLNASLYKVKVVYN